MIWIEARLTQRQLDVRDLRSYEAAAYAKAIAWRNRSSTPHATMRQDGLRFTRVIKP